MEQIYLIGMPIYFVFYLIFAAFAIRDEFISNPNADKFLIWYATTIGVFSVFIWPIALIVTAIFFAIIGSSYLISR